MGTAVKRPFVVGYIGTHGMAHGLENILRAADHLKSTPIKFLFVGAGARREELIAESKQLELGNVVFVPSQPKDRMPAFWSLCDVALVHLRNTLLFQTVIPSKIFEAMGMGLPVLLVCPEGEASRIVIGEAAGIWVPPEDPVALANAVVSLQQDPALLARLAQASRLAAPRYTRERQAREMLSRLEQVARTTYPSKPPISLRSSS